MHPAASHPHTPGAGETDHLASAVLRALGRSYYNQFSLSPVRAALTGLITFGVGPFVLLDQQLRGFITFEKQQLAYLAEWLRTRGAEQPEVNAVADFTKTLDQREGAPAFAKLVAFVALILMFVLLQDRFSVDSLLNATWRFRQLPEWQRHDRFGPAFLAWNVGLSLAFVLHWIQVRLHARDMIAWLEKFNLVAQRQGVDPIHLPWPGRSLNVGWVIAAVALSMLGAFWSIPMALAAANQRRYINVTGQQLRGQIIGRMRLMMLNQSPPMAVPPSYVIHGLRCENGLCRAALPLGARFCPRCGSAVAQARVA